MRRVKKIVNISNKLILKGFKIWILINQGYVLNWMYYIKNQNKNEKFQNICNYWIKDLEFNKIQIVVLNLLIQNDIVKNYFHIV